ncbi:MAG: ATP-binding protein, partial [Bacteroidetes bacterium]|nr:ATP-binding protein [Bacteroidota bacterium]
LSSKNLTLRANLLQENLEFTKSLQDKLKQGLFMINRDLTFKQTHSRTIHEILSVPSLEGKNLSDILSASIDQKSMMSLIDYLEMVFEGSLDQKMLDEINPIHVFNYQNPETGERKVLKTDFARVTERGNTFVMGTVEDITEKSDLEMEFSDEESQKDKEMRALFQVVQLDSQVLMDFIEDAEHEFEGINEILKGEKQLHQDKLTEVFQSLHSIKSNALILNLETFADKLHKMESSVKKLQENKGYFGGMIPFDAILSLVLELDETMKEMDHLETAVSKIVNYKTVSDEKADQKRQVLEETLIQICNKTSSALNKNARLLVSEIDVLALDYGPRRVIKEVITQLIRNAIYHGIEAPGQRTALGKDPEGEIRVSVVCKNDQIVIKVSDDGSGIDLEKLKQKVKSSKLLQNLIDINNKNFLLQMLFSPGFSTAQEADLHAGRGIGLSLVKDRIKDLRGNIKISTFSGKGTTFTLSIPMEIPQSAKVS